MKRGLCLMGALWMMMAVFSAEVPGRAEDAYESHSRESGRLPFALGTSYYEYQWGLKNNGDFAGVREDVSSGSEEGGERNRILVNNSQIQQDAAGDGKMVKSAVGADIGIEPAWDFYRQVPDRRPVIVAVIDTGVDISHPELAGSLWINEDEIPGDGIDNDNNGYVDDVNGWNFCTGNNRIMADAGEEHGTHGAGTIAAAWDGQGTMGIGDNGWVKLMVLKVLDAHDGKGVSSAVKKAVKYAQDNGAQICNLSMGTMTHDRELEKLICGSPMLFVVSAGNGDVLGQGYSIDELPMYPASFPADNIITVGSLLFDGTMDASSNYGKVSVDLAAPGISILGPVPGGEYAFMSGTSMAAPMVTGTAALVYSCRTDLDMMGVKKAILDSARPVECMKGKTVTGGVLDAYGAVTYGAEVE